MTFITINYTLNKPNTPLYLYKFPLLVLKNTASSTSDPYERLKRIFIEDSEGEITELDLNMEDVVWKDQDLESRLRQVFLHYNESIIAEYH